MRLAQHLTALRAWCKKYLPGRWKPDVLRPGIVLRTDARVCGHTTTAMRDMSTLSPRLLQQIQSTYELRGSEHQISVCVIPIVYNHAHLVGSGPRERKCCILYLFDDLMSTSWFQPQPELSVFGLLRFGFWEFENEIRQGCASWPYEKTDDWPFLFHVFTLVGSFYHFSWFFSNFDRPWRTKVAENISFYHFPNFSATLTVPDARNHFTLPFFLIFRQLWPPLMHDTYTRYILKKVSQSWLSSLHEIYTTDWSFKYIYTYFVHQGRSKLPKNQEKW